MILTLLAMVLLQTEPVLETEFHELSTGNPDRAIVRESASERQVIRISSKGRG